MALRDFLSDNRAEVLSLCLRKLRQRAPNRSDEDLNADLPRLLDDLIVAMGTTAEDSESPAMRQLSSAAEDLGRQRQRHGYDVALTSLSLGAISDSMGELAASQGLSFEAKDY